MNTRIPRVGLVVPAPGVVTRDELTSLLGDVAELTFVDVDVRTVSVQANVSMLATQFVPALRTLADRGSDLVVQVGTVPSISLGPHADALIGTLAAAATPVEAVVAMDATVAVLRQLGVRSLAVVAPLDAEMSERLRSYLTHYGFEVERLIGLGGEALSATSVHAFESTAVSELVAQAIEGKPVDCVYIFGGGWPSLDFIEAFYEQTQLPVISSNLATAIYARSILNLPSLDRFGPFARAFDHPAPPSAAGA